MFPSCFELVLWIYPNSRVLTNLPRCRIPLPFARPWLRRKWPWLRWKVDASGCGETQPGLVSPQLRMIHLDVEWCSKGNASLHLILVLRLKERVSHGLLDICTDFSWPVLILSGLYPQDSTRFNFRSSRFDLNHFFPRICRRSPTARIMPLPILFGRGKITSQG